MTKRLARIEMTDQERAAVRDPRLLHGLGVATRNLLEFAADKISPDPDADEAQLRPSFELREYFERIKES